MEHGPSNPTSFETPTVETVTSDKKDTKSSKKSSSESRTTAKQQKVERDLASSLDRMSLFEGAKAEKAEKPNSARNSPEATPLAPDTATEQLTSAETQHVQQTIARDHLETIHDTDTEMADELKPAADFLQEVSEGADVEAAFAETAAKVGMDEAAIAEALAADPEADAEPRDIANAEVEPSADDEVSIDLHSTNEGVAPIAGGGGTGGNSGGRGGSGGTGGGGNGGTPPPFGPVPGGGASQPPRPSPPSGQFNTLPAANTYYYRRNNRAKVLAAGLTGYLLGRRRGRIKTEQKLLPVQRKLERQVTRLERDITRKEQLLIQASAVSKTAVHERTVPISDRSETARIKPIERVQPGRHETRLGLQKPERAERLGHMAIGVEAPSHSAEKIVERVKFERPNNIRQAFRPEHVKNMHRNEVLELSEKIVVEGASLRRIYESHLIGEKQLRHLVTEYLSGRDIRHDLRKEMVEREIDFERDPILRDRVRSRLAGHADGGGLNELLARAGALPSEDDGAYDKRQSDADKRSEASQKRAQRQRQTADNAMITAIVVLAVVVLVLVLRR